LLAAALLATAVAQGVGRFVITPLLPGMRAAAGLDAAQAGLVGALNFAGYLAGSLWLAARAHEGRLGPVRLGLALVLGGAAAMAIAPALAPWLAARFVAGCGGALLFLGALDAYARHAPTPADVRPLAGVGLGIAATGLAVLPWLADWRAGWLVAAALGLAAAPLIVRLPAGAAHSAPVREPPPAHSGPMLRFALSYAGYGFAFGAAGTFFVNVVSGGALRAAALAWVVVGLCAAASIPLWARVRRRTSGTRALFAANAIHALSILLVALDPRPLTALGAGVLFGGTVVAITALGLPLARALAPRSPRRAAAWVTALFGIGNIAGPPAVGWLGERLGSLAHGLYGAALVAALAALALVPDLRRGI
jgi:predicted MFS family arabinose efflux permease